MYEFSLSRSDDEKDTTPIRPRSSILGGHRKRVILGLSLVIIVLVAAIGGGIGGSLAAANARRYGHGHPVCCVSLHTH